MISPALHHARPEVQSPGCSRGLFFRRSLGSRTGRGAALCSKPLFHPRIGFVNNNSNATLPDFQVGQTLRDEVVNVSGGKLPPLSVSGFVCHVARWLRLARGIGRS